MVNELIRSVANNYDESILATADENAPSTAAIWNFTDLETKSRILTRLVTSATVGFQSSSDILYQQNVQLRHENFTLKLVINRIEERLAHLESLIPEQKTIVLRELTKTQALGEIKSLFDKGEILYYSDIAERLGLDLQQVVELCNELRHEGEIGVVGTTL